MVVYVTVLLCYCSVCVCVMLIVVIDGVVGGLHERGVFVFRCMFMTHDMLVLR